MEHYNLPAVAGMVFDPRNWKLFLKVHRMFRKDPNYKISKLMKTMLHTTNGERIIRHEGRSIVTSFLPPIPSRAFESVISASKHEDNQYTQQMNAQRKAPISVFMSVTSKCSFNCVHCSEKNRDQAGELSTEQWKNTIRSLQDMGTAILGFTGGEPLLRKDIVDLISTVDDRSISILYTSGFHLTAEKAKELKNKGLFAVGISLDSPYEQVHNKQRGIANAFGKAIEAIGIARKAGLYTIAQSMIFPKNLSEGYLFDLFKLAYDAGAQEVRILEPIPSGKLLHAEESTFFTDTQREYLKEIQYKANRHKDFPKITTFAHTESAHQYGCGAGTQHSYISSGGDLFPCDFVPLSFGNVQDKDIALLWSEMNQKIGIPKLRCFAMDLQEEFKKDKDQSLPLSKEKSCELCAGKQSNEFPEFYKLLQGKK